MTDAMDEYIISFIRNNKPSKEIELTDLGKFVKPNKRKVTELNKLINLIGVKGKFSNVRVLEDLPQAWDARCREKFTSGEWIHPPWDSMGSWKYFKTNSEQYQVHQPHFLKGKTYKDAIYFYATDRDRKFDQISSLKPGKYIKTFVDDTAHIREYTDMLEVYEIFYAYDPNEIEEIYIKGPSSCMGGYDGKLQSWRTRAYGAGDIAIAYLKHGSSIVARSVVVPEQKIFISTYGPVHYKLNSSLRLAGYKINSVFHNVKLLKLANQYDEYYFPYFDFGYEKMIDNDERTLMLVPEKYPKRRLMSHRVKSTDIIHYKGIS